MIKPQELRSGNTVYNIDGEVYTADFITIRMAQNYDPIPLTEDILTRSGFKKDDALWVHPDFMLIEVEGKYYQFAHVQSGIEIQHVHQLENRVYSMTGKELEVNL